MLGWLVARKAAMEDDFDGKGCYSVLLTYVIICGAAKVLWSSTEPNMPQGRRCLSAAVFNTLAQTAFVHV